MEESYAKKLFPLALVSPNHITENASLNSYNFPQNKVCFFSKTFTHAVAAASVLWADLHAISQRLFEEKCKGVSNNYKFSRNLLIYVAERIKFSFFEALKESMHDTPSPEKYVDVNSLQLETFKNEDYETSSKNDSFVYDHGSTDYERPFENVDCVRDPNGSVETSECSEGAIKIDEEKSSLSETSYGLTETAGSLTIESSDSSMDVWSPDNCQARALAQTYNLRAVIARLLQQRLNSQLPTDYQDAEKLISSSLLLAAHWCCLWHDRPCGIGSLYTDLYEADLFATGSGYKDIAIHEYETYASGLHAAASLITKETGEYENLRCAEDEKEKKTLRFVRAAAMAAALSSNK
ncbi:Virion protein US10 [Cacatuid alphaherpesvirus 2]|uniref:Virion protein US10 n=1 Tax=Cacatuid alphaherpesvirus 2 TaxID=2604840 RepID=A0A5B9R2P3_9ALPH|nr:Virion protein US10 [Cacatuid alphaherpesvirus 2]QEG54084.1 Virion protein US10 [Cacatuid alphaherpesvirus 2]